MRLRPPNARSIYNAHKYIHSSNARVCVCEAIMLIILGLHRECVMRGRACGFCVRHRKILAQKRHTATGPSCVRVQIMSRARAQLEGELIEFSIRVRTGASERARLAGCARDATTLTANVRAQN